MDYSERCERALPLLGGTVSWFLLSWMVLSYHEGMAATLFGLKPGFMPGTHNHDIPQRRREGWS